MKQEAFNENSNEDEKLLKLIEYVESHVASKYPNLEIKLESTADKFSVSLMRKNVKHYNGFFQFNSFEELEKFILDEDLENIINISEHDLKNTHKLNDEDLSAN